MPKTLTIARREFLNTLQRPGFLLTTLGIPALVALMLFLANQSQPTQSLGQAGAGGIGSLVAQQHVAPIGYADASGTIRTVPALFPAGLMQAFPAEAAGRAALQAGTIGSLYVLPADYRASGRVVHYQRGLDAGSGVSTEQLFRLLLVTNLLPHPDPALALRLEEPMRLRTVALRAAPATADASDPFGANYALATTFASVLTFGIFMAAGILLQALLDEKENRVIEVLLTSSTPRQVLTGKVLGLGLLGLVQLGAWLALGALLLGSRAPLIGVLGTVHLPAGIWALTILYFVLGYLFMAALMAGIGAISPSMKEASQYSVGLTFVALAPLFLLSALVSDPQGGLAIGLSLFPPTAAVTMVTRLTVAAVPAWQLALSLGLLGLAGLGTLWGAARLFRTTTLLAGQRLSWRAVRAALRA